jgi:cell division protein FtsW
MRTHKPDKGLIVAIFALLIFGLIILFSASAIFSQENWGNSYHYFLHQLIYGVATGLVLFYICQKIDYKFWKKISFLILLIALILSVLVFVPKLGIARGGAQRWLDIGPISFQPSEFLKLAIIIYLAAFFSKKETKKINTLIPFLATMGIAGSIVALQSDVGTLTLIVIVGSIIYFLSGAKLYQIAIVVFTYSAGFFALIKFFPHRMERFITFLNPGVDPQGISYQINQALLAIGSGGLFGRGLGHSQQKFNFLPEPMGDSIFAIACEEIGFVFILCLILLYLFLAFKCLKMARKTPDDFGKLLTLGIISWFMIQTTINIAATTGLIPLTGVPLPFVSYGGTALMSILAASGILVNISKHQN